MPKARTLPGLEVAHIYQCKDRWKGVVRIGGKPIVVWGKSHAEALDKLNVKRAALAAGNPSGAQFAQTVGRLCLLWLDAIGENVPVGVIPSDISRRVARSGVDAYRAQISRNVLRTPTGCTGQPLGDLTVVALRRNHVVQLLEEMRAAGLSSSIRQGIRNHLLKTLRYGVQIGWTGAEAAYVAVQTTARPQNVEVRKATALTAEQVRVLLDAAADTPIASPLTVLFYSGLRIGELLALQWEDVDLEAGVIHVRASMKREGGKRVRGTVKTAAALRDVPILPQSLAALERQRKARNLDNPYVFPGVNGGMDRTTFWKALKAVAAVALPGVRVHAHQTRHTFVTLLRDAGMEFDAIASVVGHSSSAITERVYDHVNPERMAKTFDQVREALS